MIFAGSKKMDHKRNEAGMSLLPRIVFSLLAIAAQASLALGQNPVVIKGKPFEKVVIVSQAKGSIDWDFDDAAFPDTRAEVCLKEKKITLFPIAKGIYVVKLIDWDGKKITKYKLEIGDGIVPPTPDDPKPTPEVLGFVTLAKVEGAKLPATAKVKAGEIAGNFEAVAAKLAATSAMTVDQANDELRAKNKATLGDAGRAEWLPWFVAWQSRADQLNDSGQLSTREHYVTAFQETAIGLKLVK